MNKLTLFLKSQRTNTFIFRCDSNSLGFETSMHITVNIAYTISGVSNPKNALVYS